MRTTKVNVWVIINVNILVAIKPFSRHTHSPITAHNNRLQCHVFQSKRSITAFPARSANQLSRHTRSWRSHGPHDNIFHRSSIADPVEVPKTENERGITYHTSKVTKHCWCRAGTRSGTMIWSGDVCDDWNIIVESVLAVRLYQMNDDGVRYTNNASFRVPHDIVVWCLSNCTRCATMDVSGRQVCNACGTEWAHVGGGWWVYVNFVGLECSGWNCARYKYSAVGTCSICYWRTLTVMTPTCDLVLRVLSFVWVRWYHTLWDCNVHPVETPMMEAQTGCIHRHILPVANDHIFLGTTINLITPRNALVLVKYNTKL